MFKKKDEVVQILTKKLKFSKLSVKKLEVFHALLINYNYKYNLISKSTEKDVWYRHILDSAQLISHIDPKKNKIIVDLGTGAGFPGIIISIYDESNQFHVKLYEKSPIKRIFLEKIKEELDLKFEIKTNVYGDEIVGDYILSRAFKKLNEILKISRETIKKPHKLIILKGKNAQSEINSISLHENYSYKLERSITDNESNIIIFDVSK
tara:strand:+ start:290 stop:913 length:624 start_codon:yes stop_codon:yes gene_type:complete